MPYPEISRRTLGAGLAGAAALGLAGRARAQAKLTLVGSRLNRKLLPQVISWLAEGKLNPAAMITQTFPAQEAQAAFELIETRPQDTIKVQLAFGE